MAILTQMIGQTDNRYQQDCVKRYPGRLSSVAWVDVDAPDVAMTIENLAREGVSGIRLRPSSCLPGGRLPEAWRAVQATGLPISCVGSAEAFNAPAFIELVAKLAGTTVVLEHLGGTSTPVTTDEQFAIRRQVFKLAAYPNVMMGKITALYYLITNLVGLALGPTVVALVAKFFDGPNALGASFVICYVVSVALAVILLIRVCSALRRPVAR